MEKFAQIFYDSFAKVSFINLDILRYLDGYFHKLLEMFLNIYPLEPKFFFFPDVFHLDHSATSKMGESIAMK